MSSAIFFDGRFFDDLGDRYRLRKAYSVPLKGNYDSHKMYELLGDNEPNDVNSEISMSRVRSRRPRGANVGSNSDLTERHQRGTVTASSRNSSHLKSGIPLPVCSSKYRPGASVETYRRSHSNNQYRQRPENLPRRQPIVSQEYPMVGNGSGGSVTSSLPQINGAQRPVNQIDEGASPEQMSTFGEDVTAKLVQREREELGRMEMNELYDRAEPASRIPLARMANLKQLLNLKPIAENTLDRYGVCALPTLDGLMFPRYAQTRAMEGDALRPSGMKIFRLIDNNDGMTTAAEEILPDSTIFNGIFGYHLIKPTDEEAVITDSELNAMAIHQATGQVVMSMPDDTGPLSIDMLPFLDDFLKLTIWVPDEKYNRAKQFARRLVAKRCFLVGPRKGRPLDLLGKRGGADEIRRILRQAAETLPKDVDTFATLRETVRDEMFGTTTSLGLAQWKRFAILNQFFRGFRLGELSLLTGPTGCGKTTFLSEYSLDLCDQNVNTLWCSFEIANSRLVAMMVQQYGRKDVTKDQNSASFDYWYEKLMQLPMYFAKFRGNTKMKAVTDAIDYHVAAQNIQHVIIDNLQFVLSNVMSSEDKQGQALEQIFSELRRLATSKNIHVTVVIHPRKEEDDRELSPNSMYGGLKAAQEADNVMIIQTRFHRLPEPYNDKYLQIWKNRFVGDLHLGNRLHLVFDQPTKCHTLVWRKRK